MTIYQGEAMANIVIKIGYDNGAKYDFTGVTEISVKFTTGGRFVQKLLSLNEITSISLGQFSVSLTSFDTNNLRPAEDGSVRITITKPSETRIAVVDGLKVRK